MASNLTKDQQLSAANSQYKNWLNQQIAANGGYYPTIDQINSYKAGILNTGLYPDLDMGVAPPAPGVDVNIAPSQFFIVGQGGDLKEDRGSGFTGQAIFSAGISDSTTLQQFTAAQDAYQLGLEQVYKTQGTELASQAQSAKEALAAAQARVEALQAQLDASSVVDTQPSSSAALQAASSAANQRLGQEISPQRETQLDAINQQYNDYRSTNTVVTNASNNNTTRDSQLATIQDSFTAQSSGGGTVIPNTNNQSINAATRGATEDATPILANQTINAATRGATEDSSGNAVQAETSTKTPATDQQSTTGPMAGTGVNSGNAVQGSAAKAAGIDSATVLSAGRANGTDSTLSQNMITPPQSGGSASRINKLHSYTNYTYRLSMYAIPRETVNAIFASKTTTTNSQILANSVFICADSGSGQNSRSSEFPVDLTIDNLELETIVNANNTRTRATDVIKLKFDIIEPYTVNFLGRLMKLSARVNPKGNWSTMFFVMKIDFLGYNDSGVPITPNNAGGEVIPQTTKFIPFTMINMKFDVTSSGGKYSIDAIPVNALALTALDNQIPFHVEVSGSTIDEIFNNNNELNSTTQNTVAVGRAQDTDPNQLVSQNTVNGNKTTVRKGLAKALNVNEEQKVAQNTQGKPNQYSFEFDSQISSKSVVDAQGYFKIQGVPGTSGKDSDEIQKGKVGSLVADLKANVFRANPGTRITDFIGSIITISEYMTKQYAQGGSKEPLYTWKITPVVEFQDIDEKTNFYARKITYVVTPYKTLGQDAPNFGQASVTQDRIVKTYKYIYSGDNRDVLDASINFQMAFFELKNGIPYNYIDRDGLTPGAQQPQTATNQPNIQKFFMPRYHYTNGLANRQNIGPTTVDLSTIAVQELMEKLFDNRGDMITLDINIVGDPDWISQDYPLMHPSIIGDSAYLQNGSINFSNAVYFNFYFATPNTDYDDNSGLFNPQGNYSEFSGIYQVVSVKSSFSGGKFTQKLTNFRVRNQQEIQTNAVRSDKPSGFDAASVAAGLSAPTIEPATNNITVPNDPRLNLNAGTNTTNYTRTPTYNITDPRVGIAQPKNNYNEDAAIRDYYLGIE